MSEPSPGYEVLARIHRGIFMIAEEIRDTPKMGRLRVHLSEDARAALMVMPTEWKRAAEVTRAVEHFTVFGARIVPTPLAGEDRIRVVYEVEIEV